MNVVLVTHPVSSVGVSVLFECLKCIVVKYYSLADHLYEVPSFFSFLILTIYKMVHLSALLSRAISKFEGVLLEDT